MPIRATCPQCSISLKGRDDLAGKRVRCAGCGAVITLPPRTTTGPGQAAQVTPSAVEPQMTQGPVVADAAAHAAAERKSAVNIPAMVGLPLAFLSWPVAALFFFAVFRQLIQSLIVGGVVALLAVGCGVAGLVVHARRGKGAVGVLLSVADIGIGGLGLALFTVIAITAKVTSDQLPPEMSVLKQVLGTERPARVPMKCQSCGHEFERSVTKLLQRQAGQAIRALRGAEDLDDVLDQVEKTARQGFVCPECKEPSARPMLTCPKCEKSFLPVEAVPAEGGRACPYCGAAVPAGAGEFLELYRIPE